MNPQKQNPNKLILFGEASPFDEQQFSFDCFCIARLIIWPVEWTHRQEEGHEASLFDAKGGGEQHERQLDGSGQLSKLK